MKKKKRLTPSKILSNQIVEYEYPPLERKKNLIKIEVALFKDVMLMIKY